MTALPLPRISDQRYLIVRLAGQEFALPVESLRGMTQMRGLDAQPIEGRGALRFVATWHGRGIPVFMPHVKLQLMERPVSARTCMLLVGRDGDQEPSCAVLVDSVSRMEEIPANRRRTAPDGKQHIWVGGKWRAVLDVNALCAE
jgi:chemotaxis signal transduction protein